MARAQGKDSIHAIPHMHPPVCRRHVYAVSPNILCSTDGTREQGRTAAGRSRKGNGQRRKTERECFRGKPGKLSGPDSWTNHRSQYCQTRNVAENESGSRAWTTSGELSRPDTGTNHRSQHRPSWHNTGCVSKPWTREPAGNVSRPESCQIGPKRTIVLTNSAGIRCNVRIKSAG